MVRRELRGMTPEQLQEWSVGKPIGEVLEETGEVPPRTAVLVALVPKNGSFNRCSVCKTAVTSATMRGRAMTITSPNDEVWSTVVIVCSERCGRRL